MDYRSISAVLLPLLMITGCDLSEEDQQRIDDAEDQLEKVALAPLITYPAENGVVGPNAIIRVDVDESITYESVTLLINGEQISTDTEYPYEFEWNSYYWSDEQNVSLMVRAITANDSLLLRSETISVSIDENAFVDTFELTTSLSGSELPNTTNELALSWKAINDASSYEYTINGGALISTTEANVNLIDLAEGTYDVQIRANIEGNAGQWNQLTSFSILSLATPAVTSPTNNLSVSDIDNYTFSWTAVDGASNYEYQLNNGALVTAADNAVSLNLPQLGDYSFRVRAINARNELSSWSAEQTVSLNAPSAPTFSVGVIENTTDFTLNITLESSTNPTTVQVSRNNSFSDKIIHEASVENTSLMQVPVTAGRYFVRAKIENSLGHQSDWSSDVEENVGLFSLETDITTQGSWYNSDSPVDFLIDGSDLVILSSSSNDYVDASGDNSDFYFSKWDQQGNEIWSQSLGSIAHSPRAISKASNGYIAVGASRSSSNDNVLINIDSGGEYQWKYDVISASSGDDIGDTHTREYVTTVKELTDNEFIFAQKTSNYTKTGTWSLSFDSSEIKVSYYDKATDISSSTVINQPSSGEYSTISEFIIDGDDIYAAGKFTANDGSYDASDDSYISAVSTSGAYVLAIDADDLSIKSEYTGGGISNSSINGFSMNEHGFVISYSNYYSGAATTFSSLLDSSSALIDGGLRFSRSVIDNNGNTIMVGMDDDSSVFGEPIVVVKYTNGIEQERLNIYKYSDDFSIRKVKYDDKYGTVILGEDQIGFSWDDTETVIFNVTDEFESLAQ